MMYIRSRSCNIDPSEDLGNVYYSSSKNRDFIKDQKINPHKYEYLILGIFKSREEADLYESMLHEKHNVDKNILFYNRAKQTTTKFRYDPTGTTLSDEWKRNIGRSLIGRPVSKKTREKLREANIGKTLSEECKHKISKARKGMKPTAETRKKMSEARKVRVGSLAPNWGKKHKRVKFPHCNKEVSINTINQYHNDNCKKNSNK